MNAQGMMRACTSCAHAWRPRVGVPVYCERWATPPGRGLAVALSHALAKGRCGPQREAWMPGAGLADGEGAMARSASAGLNWRGCSVGN